MTKENIYLASKPRYDILDGLRGVAALMVIIFHLFETYCPRGGQQIINHGYLAVDFFFLLSGFVIGYAYDDRWDKMTIWGFFKRRLTRLHPMVIAGTVVGFCFFFFAYDSFPMVLQSPAWKVALCFVLALLMIPCVPQIDIRGWSDFNPFNGPNWTLTFEYFGNILYALVLRHLPKIAIAVLCVASAFFTLDLTLGWDVFGFFPFREIVNSEGVTRIVGGPRYNVIGGWCLTPKQLYIGFARFLYPFFCGLLISRILPSHRSESNPSGSPIQMKYGFLWTSILLVAILSIPCIGGKPGVPNGIYQAVSIILLFPLIVIMGAGSVTRTSFGTRLCKFLGEISYPIYITHYPMLYLQIAFARRHPEAPQWIHVMVSVSVLLFAIILSYGLLKSYDEPVRRWLTEHWLKRRSKS